MKDLEKQIEGVFEIVYESSFGIDPMRSEKWNQNFSERKIKEAVDKLVEIFNMD